MPQFVYRVKDSSGHTQEGTIEADDQRAAASALLGAGHHILSLQQMNSRPARTASLSPMAAVNRWVLYPLVGGVTVANLAFFYRQLATMVKSGIPLVQSLNSLSTRAPNSRLRRIAWEACQHTKNGGALSDVFAQYPWVFPELHIAMLRAGEAGGRLDVMIERIADYLDREHSMRQKVRIATFYPKILVLAVIFIPALPKLILDGFRAYWNATVAQLLPLLGGLLLLWVLYRILYQLRGFRYVIDVAKLLTPGIGKVVRQLALSRFYRALSALIAAGVPLPRAILHSADASGNGFFAPRLKRAVPMAEAGRSLTDSLSAANALPPLALDMISTGEQTGNVDEMLDKAADYSESAAEVASIQGVVVLSVVLLLGLAVYIGFFVIQFYTGYFTGIMDTWIDGAAL